MINNNDRVAFPNTNTDRGEEGLSKLEYASIHIFSAVSAQMKTTKEDYSITQLIADSIEDASELLNALEEGKVE